MDAGKRASAAELFQKYDADSSGTIDMDELTLMMAECGYGHPPKELMSEFATGMDEDLDYEAFAAMLRSLDARTQFEKFDVDRSGGIDVDELLAAMHACGHTSAGAPPPAGCCSVLERRDGAQRRAVPARAREARRAGLQPAPAREDGRARARADAPRREEPRLVCVVR